LDGNKKIVFCGREKTHKVAAQKNAELSMHVSINIINPRAYTFIYIHVTIDEVGRRYRCKR
jgi:hypothetical protein